MTFEKSSTPEHNSLADIEFLETLKNGSEEELLRWKLNLMFGGPEWMRIALDRALKNRFNDG